jgi:hypothetical protein
MAISRHQPDEPPVDGAVELTDIQIWCRDCGAAFVFTVGEQQFFRATGLTNTPRRCRDCRKARKALAAGSA